MEGVMQFYINVEKEEGKFDKLCDLYDALCITSQSVIFVNTRLKADWLTQKMRSKLRIAFAIHDDTDQFNRARIVREFHIGTSPVLITSTDLLSSNINVENVSLAINYDLPTQPEQYQRIQMFGRTGVAINFVTEDEKGVLQDIEKACNVDIRELPFSTS
ncbi:eukaryotic initiation factor 4A-6-like [Argentina anserina]|uniref:eukaryotic initiation factor 4A-6-like n=1 Tax=Argentina anserina TaxID=57926 RepID=UPI002176368D|nr:eukaryotic initiation factor 4A-6-like [Potentilla anserina]